MNLFQIIMLPTLIAGTCYCTWRAIAHHRRRFILAAFVLAAAAVCVANPSITTWVARFLGIGRGADLVSYLGALGVIGAWLLTLNCHRRLRLELTELTRQLALRDLDQQRDRTDVPVQAGNRPEAS